MKPPKSGHLQIVDNFDQTVVVHHLEVSDYSKRDRHKNIRLKKGRRLKKEQYELVFRIQSNIYERAFLQK